MSQVENGIDGMGRLLKFLRAHQRRGGTCRISDRRIAEAIDISPRHVGRLRRAAIQQGLLVSTGDGVTYRRIAVEESTAGKRWIPKVTCSWDGSIDWTAKDGEGEFISTKAFSLPPRGEIWMVTFDSWEPVTTHYPPRLGPGVVAFVRPLKDPTDVRVGDWCLVWFGWEWIMSAFRVPLGFQRACDLNFGLPRLETDLARHVAVIEAVHFPCTRKQNKIRLEVSQTVTVVADSPLIQDSNRKWAGIINVDPVKLRRALKRRRRVRGKNRR